MGMLAIRQSVGSTGLSTGPHLDFRFWKNGKPVDPIIIDPPSANPIKEDHMDNYSIIKDSMIRKLDAMPDPEIENIS